MTDTPEINCSIARALGEVGERWSLLIVREAIMGSSRFDAFQARLGIARNILTDRLAGLVRDGVMTKTPSPENARIPIYRLTQKGQELLPALAALMQWGDRWIHAEIGPPIVLADKRTGRPVRAIALEAQVGVALDRAEIAILPGPGATPTMRKRLAGA
jgi:DNA-binding HxlR family transcriptional regulator